MRIMRMSYDDLSNGGGAAKLHVYGVGTYPVFSGDKPYTNDPNCAYKVNSAIPVAGTGLLTAQQAALPIRSGHGHGHGHGIRCQAIDTMNGSGYSAIGQ